MIGRISNLDSNVNSAALPTSWEDFVSSKKSSYFNVQVQGWTIPVGQYKFRAAKYFADFFRVHLFGYQVEELNLQKISP